MKQTEQEERDETIKFFMVQSLEDEIRKIVYSDEFQRRLDQSRSGPDGLMEVIRVVVEQAEAVVMKQVEGYWAWKAEGRKQ